MLFSDASARFKKY